MTKRLEKDVKGAIVAYLKLRGHFPIPYRNVGIKKMNGRYIPCSMLGVSDIIGCTKDGKFFAVEVKAPGKKNTLTDYQRDFLDDIKDVHGIVCVADCLEDVQAAGL